VGITAPSPHLPIDAAHELARVIFLAIEGRGVGAPAADEPALPL